MTDPISSQQTIADWTDCETEHPKWSQNSIEDYMQLKEDTLQLIEFVNDVEENLSPQSGTGSPEGVVTANVSKMYVDTVVPTLYFNDTIGADTGWIAL